MHIRHVSAAFLVLGSTFVAAQAPAAGGAVAPAPAAPVAQVAGPAAADAPVSPLAAAYPNMPTSWPDPDETKGGINLPALLNAPLVLEGLKKVQAVVPAAILALPTSKQLVLGSGDVTYPGGAAAQAANCHQPAGCFRTTATAYYQPDITACPAANTWGLTYDDGPTAAPDSPNSADLRGQLMAMNQQKATFFVAGSPGFYQPAELKNIYDAGHEIAVHTWTHAALTSLTNAQIVAEILYTEAWIVRTLGVKPVMFRPPFGDVDDRVRGIIGALGYKNVMWLLSRDTQDTTDITSDAVVASVKTWFTPQPGFIALEHNITPKTTNTSIQVLKSIQAAGAAFPLKMMPVGVCLGIAPYVGGNATVAPATASSSAAAVPSAASTLAPITSTQVVQVIATQKPASAVATPIVASTRSPATASQPAQVFQSGASATGTKPAAWAAAGALLAGFFYSA
ncbi:chitin deacetylase [Geranomyces variabilis]|uniref:Chitin deacetylase n=1 Tax=Geranomyces variabilis TaxID=109894 RepID=A0AAD5TJJ9_9FUNG|nr:chitin deacetylase [Geranomyces variabilis]